MDLAALWNREKARIAAELHHDIGSPGSHGSHGHTDNSHGEDLFVPHAQRVRAPAPALNGGTPGRHKSAATASPVASGSKKKVSAASNASIGSTRDRDRVFRVLVESSVAPVAAETVSTFFGCNEFAMEYADRAVRRFFGGPQPSQQLPPAPSFAVSNSVIAVLPNRGQEIRNPSARVNSVVPLHAQSSSTQTQVGLSSIQAASSFPTTMKTALGVRKNGRKRAGTEFSSQAFKPYVGDMFSTRGEYIDGLLYMSRMKRSYQATFGGSDYQGKRFEEVGGPSISWVDLQQPEGRDVLKDGVSDALTVAAGGAAASEAGGAGTGPRRLQAAGSISLAADGSGLGGENKSALTKVQRKQRQRCSLTLSNWSFNPENARLMVQENVVEALIQLCKDEDATTRLNCVTALMNLSHLGELRRLIVQQGAVRTVAEIVNDMADGTIRTACAITLCNLCSLDGEEGMLVEDGAVSALSTLINEHEKVSCICRSALFNLTCVSQSYHKIESVLKVFLTLTNTRNGGASGDSGTTEEEYDDITAKALCNLSNLKRIRLRLMEEGIVSAIVSLLHPNIPSIQELLAYILLNLSRLPACRSEMITKGCMSTLVALTGSSNALGTKFLIGNALWNLSKDPGNAVRMVVEGFLLLLNELCREVGTNSSISDPSGSTASIEEDLLRVCARTLYNVSCCEDARVKLVERDAVNILSSLSRRASGSDAKQMCTLALCNLLSVQKAAADIMTAGAIMALIQLSMAPAQPYETRNLFSKALHGLCDKASTRVAVTEAGVIPALLLLSSIDEVDPPGSATTDSIRSQTAGVLSVIRARCTAALACLAADMQTAPHVCNAAVVQCVTRILALEHSNVAIERFCCSCLSLLCRDEQCSLIMVEVGAIEMVLATCVESHDLESKASCCHVLASMSCHPSCCMALVRMGAISVLATLAKIKEDVGIQRCCAITLANLSVEPSIREILASAGTVAILAVLSDSYSEESQRDCAKVLCNLSCICGNEAALVGEGAVGVLMMISMVRAVNVVTKETCLRALLNLLNAETMKHMVKEGLVKVLPAIAGWESKQVAKLVAILFSKLLNHPVGRNALCAERSALQALFQLMVHDTQTTKELEPDGEQQSMASLYENLLSELVYFENSRLLSVHTGIFDALHRITTHESDCSEDCDHIQRHCTERKLALVFFTLAKSEDSRPAVASYASLATLMKFLKLHAPKDDCRSSDCALFAVATLCRLGWHEDTRRHLQFAEIPRALTRMLRMNAGAGDCDGREQSDLVLSYPAQAIKTCVLTLCCLTHSPELLEVMLQENILIHLNGILAANGQISNAEGVQGSLLTGDPEFVALVCILFRQLSHVALFSSSVAQQPAPILQLFCVLVQQVVATTDADSCLDCADALCSIVFASTLQQQSGYDARNPGDESPVVPAPRPTPMLVESSVLGAIGALLSDNQLPETRWRCAASLWALSAVPEHCRQLVDFGVTRMLVNESYRAADSASLNTLQCCAGALCNLTIVPQEANAARMVEEGAMPALIQLAKLENDMVREHCTLALSNLSGPSPKVESGAVSALLNLSLGFASSPVPTATSGSKRASNPAIRSSQQQTAVLGRPPLVCGERHKHFAVPPEFAMEITTDSALNERKFEADLVASTPPPPHLPTIAADPDASSSSSLDTSGAEHSGVKGATATAPSHVEEGITTTTKRKSESSAEAVTERDDAPRESVPTKFFTKVDPEESLATMTAMEQRIGDRNASQTDGHREDAVGNQEHDSTALDQPDASNAALPKGPSSRNDLARLTEHADVGRLQNAGTFRKLGVSGASSSSTTHHTLSPLARVVVRKANAVRKFNGVPMRKLRHGEDSHKRDMVMSQSSPCLFEPRAVGADEVAASVGHSGTGAEGKQPSQLSSLSSSVSTSLLSSGSEADEGISDPRAALIAAVAAAGLYDAAPMQLASSSFSVATAASRQKQKTTTSLTRKKKEEKVSAADTAAVMEEAPAMALMTPPTTIEEFQVQAKKLGLWSYY
ncbi:hypothetical protein BBJ28_00015493 [Nothophytophthora sp. Chile5]|nr:hypothetical protein BBJ28_00015493 [Nothophytophthora sp. Chile5]